MRQRACCCFAFGEKESKSFFQFLETGRLRVGSQSQKSLEVVTIVMGQQRTRRRVVDWCRVDCASQKITVRRCDCEQGCDCERSWDRPPARHGNRRVIAGGGSFSATAAIAREPARLLSTTRSNWSFAGWTTGLGRRRGASVSVPMDWIHRQCTGTPRSCLSTLACVPRGLAFSWACMLSAAYQC